MNDQHRNDPSQPNAGKDKARRDAQGQPNQQQGGANNPGQHQQGQPNQQRDPNQKPKTEQASHQGGGGVRSDHKPQGPGSRQP